MGPILRQLDLTNLFTLGGLALAMVAVVQSAHGRFATAALCLVGCGLVDLFDGFLAKGLRRRPEAAAAGPGLDSLVDVGAFGLAPALFVWFYAGGSLAATVAVVPYLVVVVLRLVYFDRQGLTPVAGADCYTGLPVTYAALFVPVAFTGRHLWGDAATALLLPAVYLLLAAAMAAGVPVRKLRGAWYAVFAAGALLLLLLNGGDALAEWRG